MKPIGTLVPTLFLSGALAATPFLPAPTSIPRLTVDKQLNVPHANDCTRTTTATTRQGDECFDTTLSSLYCYNGTVWQACNSGSGGSLPEGVMLQSTYDTSASGVVDLTKGLKCCNGTAANGSCSEQPPDPGTCTKGGLVCSTMTNIYVCGDQWQQGNAIAWFPLQRLNNGALVGSIDLNNDGTAEIVPIGNDVAVSAPYGAVRVAGSALAPMHLRNVDLGTRDDQFGYAFISGGVDLNQDGAAELGFDGQKVFLHGTADGANMLGGYYPSDFALASTLDNYIASAQKGAANGVASLGSDGKVPSGQLPPAAAAPLTTKGDLYGYDGSASARVPVGGDGSLLIADSTQTAGLAYRSVEWIQRGTVDGVPAGILPQSDEFLDTSLNAKWLSSGGGAVSTTVANGFLTYAEDSTAGRTIGYYPFSRLYQSSVPAEDFAIVAKVTNIWASSADALNTVVIAGATVPGTSAQSPAVACKAGYIIFATGFGTANGDALTQQGGNGGTCVAGWYALEYVGTTVSGYKSSDGVNWTKIGSSVTLATRPTQIGLGAMTCESCAYGPYYASATFDYWRVASAKNAFGVKSWYLNSYTGPFHFTGSDLRADDTTSREGVFAANGPVKLWSDQNNDAAADRHVRIYHGSKVAPQVDFDGSTNTAKFDLDSDGTTDYTLAKPASACASGMEMAINASGQVVCKTRSPLVILPPLGSCDNGGNYSSGAWSSTGAVAVACEDVRGFYKHPYFSYPDGSSNVMAYSFLAPDNWDGTLTITLWWSGSQTSGAVRWFEGHDCFASGSTFYSQPTTTATVDSTAAGTAYKQTAVTLSVTGLSSCAGGMTTILVGRDGTHANDTYTGAVQVNGIKIALGAK